MKIFKSVESTEDLKGVAGCGMSKDVVAFDLDFNHHGAGGLHLPLCIVETIEKGNKVNLFLQGMNLPPIDLQVYYTLLRCAIENRPLDEEDKKALFDLYLSMYKMQTSIDYVAGEIDLFPDYLLYGYALGLLDDNYYGYNSKCYSDAFISLLYDFAEGQIDYETLIEQAQELKNKPLNELE